MKNLFNMNFFSWLIKGILGIATLLVSAILSYTFFLAISPANMAVFPFAALTLTEGGFVGWLLIFALMKHHKITSVIALVMIALCFITTLVVTFAELIQLFQDHTLVSNDTVRNGTLILLEIMLGLHILAVASDFLIIKIEWLIREYLPQNVTVVESHSPALPALVQQPTQAQVTPVQSPASQPVPLDNALVQQAIDYVKLAQAMQALQQASPLSQTPLQTQANQAGTNGNGHKE